MRAIRTLAAVGVCWLGWAAGPAAAAWDNVFQVCCHGCRQQPRASFYVAPTPAVSFAPPVVAAAPPTTCCAPPMVPVTSYVQRSFYQPVTSFRTSTFYEPVTSFQTSYFYEPVTSFRVSCSIDPCTGCPVQVTTPVTSFRLRSQCNAVQSYVQRQALVPVTTYQQSFFLEAVTTLQPACPQPACPACPAPAVAAPAPAALPPAAAAQAGATTLPPTQVPLNPPAGSQESRSPVTPPPAGSSQEPPPAMPPAGTSQRQYTNPPRTPTTLPPIPIRISRMASRPTGSAVAGQLVARDYITPRPGSTVRFVSATGAQEAATTDAAGRFRVALAAGRWQVYVPGSDGKPAYHSKIDVRENESRDVVVVSR
jgi:hypothetical protein